MSTASYKTIQALEQVVKPLPVGTNLALLQLMWAMLTGAFLQGRGAVHTALSESGFSDSEIRRSWHALRYGKWDVRELITRWRHLVLSEKRWQAREYEGWRPLAVDITAFWRPQLKFWSNKFFHRLANRLMKGVGFGVITQVDEVDGQRLPLLKCLIRANPRGDGETELKATILRQVPLYLDEQEVFVHDAGVGIADMHEAGIARFVIRLAVNCTGRRNHLPSTKKRGRPTEYGQLIRPLPRKRGNKHIPATAPDRITNFQFGGRTIEVHSWTRVVCAGQKVSASNKSFTVWVFHDPLYKKPLVLGTNLSAQAETIFRLYLDRWPVEQPPLVAKQMLGLHRQFVFAPVSCQRLPELALLTGNILTYLAGTLPPIPTGFWDRHPKKRRGGFGEHYPELFFPKLTHLMSDFEKSTPLPLIYPRELPLIAG